MMLRQRLANGTQKEDLQNCDLVQELNNLLLLVKDVCSNSACLSTGTCPFFDERTPGMCRAYAFGRLPCSWKVDEIKEVFEGLLPPRRLNNGK